MDSFNRPRLNVQSCGQFVNSTMNYQRTNFHYWSVHHCHDISQLAEVVQLSRKLICVWCDQSLNSMIFPYDHFLKVKFDSLLTFGESRGFT